jgi:hypothetical protein
LTEGGWSLPGSNGMISIIYYVMITYCVIRFVRSWRLGVFTVLLAAFVVTLIGMACRILYPGYFSRTRIDKVNLVYYFGQEATSLFEALSEQVSFALRHECRRHNLPCFHCDEKGQEIAVNFMKEILSVSRFCLQRIFGLPMKVIPQPRVMTKSYSVIRAFLPLPYTG